MNKLTDSEAIKALFAAHIPPVYHRKDIALATMSPQWAEVPAAVAWAEREAKDFASQGQGIEIAFEGKPALDFAFLLARRLQLSSVPVIVIALPTLVNTIARRYELEAAERISEWDTASFLFLLDGFSPDEPPYPRTMMFEAGWFLRSWLLNGRSLVMQGKGRLSACPWWACGLPSLFAERLPLVFEGPPEQRKPLTLQPKPFATRNR